MKPYLVQTLRLAHKCVRQAPTHLYLMLVGYFCLTSKAIFHYQDINNCMSRLFNLTQHIKIALTNEIIVIIVIMGCIIVI